MAADRVLWVSCIPYAPGTCSPSKWRTGEKAQGGSSWINTRGQGDQHSDSGGQGVHWNPLDSIGCAAGLGSGRPWLGGWARAR